MPREIKFRGRDIETEKFVYGDLITAIDGMAINCNDSISLCDVIPQSVGQFTGLKDKNGIEIYEGDRVNSGYFKDCIVVFWNSGWHFKSDVHSHHSFNTAKHSFEVIGNIYEKGVKDE